MPTLTKQEILAAEDLKRETVEVEAWGGAVVVSEMSANTRMEWEAVAFDADGKPIPDGWKSRLVAACVVDDAGDRMFSNDEIAELGRKSDSAITTIYRAAAALNGIGPKAKEEAEKN